jgi:hypothetical protein
MNSVTWNVCRGVQQREWCSLYRLELPSIGDVGGVYVIWKSLPLRPPITIRLGQGIIADRLLAHRVDPAIGRHRENGELWVTWAELPGWMWDGVERFLADRLNPQVGDAFPAVAPLAVNLPW